MVRKFLLFMFVCSIVFSLQAEQKVNGHPELWTRRWNEVTYVSAHNIALAPSIVNNQKLPFVELLDIGVRAFKIPVHFEEDYGCRQGNRLMASHGLHRSVFYDDYFKLLFESINRKLDKLESKRIMGLFFKILLMPMRKILERYRQGLRPVADMELAARKFAYGSSHKKAMITYSPCVIDPSSRPFIGVLKELHNFLTANPQEVVSITLDNLMVNHDAIGHDFKEAELLDYVHVQDKTKPWPTLGQMVTDNKRLIVFVYKRDKEEKYPWMHCANDYFWSSNSGFRTRRELLADMYIPESDSNFKRRHEEPKNTVFFLGHGIKKLFGAMHRSSAKINVPEILKKRVENIAVSAKQQPTFISLDFIGVPNNNMFDFVDHINGVGKWSGRKLFDFIILER